MGYGPLVHFKGPFIYFFFLGGGGGGRIIPGAAVLLSRQTDLTIYCKPEERVSSRFTLFAIPSLQFTHLITYPNGLNAPR